MTTRTGLYIMAIITLIGLCGIESVTNRTEKKLDSLIERVSLNNISPISEVGRNGSITNKYFLINGQRAYVEIDGKPCESYIPKN